LNAKRSLTSAAEVQPLDRAATPARSLRVSLSSFLSWRLRQLQPDSRIRCAKRWSCDTARRPMARLPAGALAINP